MTVPALAGELDLPVRLLNQRSVGVPVQGSNSPANFYLNVTVLVKADMGDLGYSSDWQDVYAAIPVTMFEASDVLIDVAPGFLLGGIERQETGLFESDDWGLALDQAPGRPPRVVPPAVGVDAWWQDTVDPRTLMLTYRVRNVGQCQIPDVCLSIDALVYRPSLAQGTQRDWRSARMSRVSAAHLAR